MFEPMKPGKHEITFKESQIEPPSLIDVTYHLAITENGTTTNLGNNSTNVG